MSPTAVCSASSSCVRSRRTPRSILCALIVPPGGGGTFFADMHAGYEGLSDELEQRIQGRRGVHPVVRTQPETGARSICVNSAFTTHIEHTEPAERARLLRHLYRQAAVPEYPCRFRWRRHSVAFRDDRATQHYAAFDFRPHTRRVERVTIAGDRPR